MPANIFGDDVVIDLVTDLLFDLLFKVNHVLDINIEVETQQLFDFGHRALHYLTRWHR